MRIAPERAPVRTPANALVDARMTVLEVRGLVVRFRSRASTIYAVNGVSFDIAAGATLALVGESGCGKTVTSLAAIGLLPRGGRVEAGEVRLWSRDLLSLSEPEMRSVRGREIAMVFQDPMTSLNPVLTVGEQVEETILAHERISKERARGRAIDLLAQVGLPEPATALRCYPHELSGGMRQRVMIAIALALDPKVLIADEPTTALDVTIQAQVLDLMRRLTRESGTALLLITHDLGVVAGMAERIAVMYAGFIVEMANAADMFAQPRHPYTVGLLRSLPRRDRRLHALTPIEGAPPDQHVEPRGCPFAPRCAWRLDICWTHSPPLVGRAGDADAAEAKRPGSGHLVACHNPVLPNEVARGRPSRAGFVPAPPPPGRDDIRLAGPAS
ncbi:MAG TPA: ABC transporter ATP-binding protein [Actinomycetota bacterium]|nr:ABC transporter ATP-binding protein [Actinomycetota bacterium]